MEEQKENIEAVDGKVFVEPATTAEETAVLANTLPPPTPDEIDKLKTMSFEERKLWLNERTFSLCATAKSVGKDVAAIMYYPNRVLKHVAEPVTDFGQETQNLIDLLVNSVYAHKGMGLAATQIGLDKRIFVVDGAANNTKSASDLRVFVNPEIIEISKETVRNGEGCLSFPSVFEQVVRPKRVAGKALDRDGKEFTFEHTGDVYAVALQHEIDHLNGVLMLDHFSRMAKRIALRKIDKDIRQRNRKPKQMQRRSW